MEYKIQIDHLYKNDQIDMLFEELLTVSNLHFAESTYRIWKSKMKRELFEGRKLATGAWFIYNGYKGRKKRKQKERKLIGVSIIGKNDRYIYPEPDLFLEMIFVDPEYRNEAYYSNSKRSDWEEQRYRVGSMLMLKIADLCQSYGYRRIITNCPTQSEELVRFLIHHEFIINGYDNIRNTYQLIKQVHPVYNKDPFDLEMILTWLFEKWKIETHQISDNRLVGKISVGKDIELSAEINILICETVARCERAYKKLLGRKNTWVILKTEDDDVETYGQNIKFLLPSDLQLATQNRAINLTMENDVIAVVVSIRKDMFNRYRGKDRGYQVFINGSEYGKILAKRESPTFIIFANAEINHEEIFGVARIVEVATGIPESIWEDWHSLSTFQSEKEFLTYISHLENRIKRER